MENLINHKQLTQWFFDKKRIKLKNCRIKTADLQHILGRDLLEIYLKLNGCKNVVWFDGVNERTTASFFMNLLNVILQVFSFPIIYIKVSLLAKRVSKSPKVIKFPSSLSFLYLRTDHWFNLKSGGSVGHVSGVVNELKERGLLKKIQSSSALHNVSFEDFLLSNPNYKYSGSIPNLSELDYNIQLYNSFSSSCYEDVNVLYQRYSKGNIYGVLLRKKLSIPLILEYNGSEIWVAKNWSNKKLLFGKLLLKLENLNLKYSDLIVVVSEPLKEELIARGVEEKKILINPNGVDVTIYNPLAKKSNLNEAYGINCENIIGFIGTFGEWHGVLVLGKAIKEFFQTFPERIKDTHFLLIGDGNLRKEVESQINQSGFENKVTFTGAVEQNLGPSMLNACTLLLSPHVPNPDGSKFFGSPTKLFEYMAMGKPIIASELGQIGDVLTNDLNALMLEPGNHVELAKAIQKLITDPKLAAKLGANALTHVKDNFTWEKHIERVFDFMNN